MGYGDIYNIKHRHNDNLWFAREHDQCSQMHEIFSRTFGEAEGVEGKVKGQGEGLRYARIHVPKVKASS